MWPCRSTGASLMYVDILSGVLMFFLTCDAMEMTQVYLMKQDVPSHRMNTIAKLIIIFCFATTTSLK